MMHGQVSAFVDVLGASRNVERYERLLVAIGGKAVVETYVDDGIVTLYESIPERGLSFLFTDDELDTVFIYAVGKAEMTAYREEAALIEGMSLEWKRTDVERALGTPVRATSNFLTYRCQRGYVQVDFDGEDIVMVVVMAELAGGDSSEVPPLWRDVPYERENRLKAVNRKAVQFGFNPTTFTVGKS